MTGRRENKKITAFIVAIFAIVLLTLFLFSYARTSIAVADAPAYADGIGWKPYVKKQIRETAGSDPIAHYENIVQPIDLTENDSIGFFVCIEDSSIVDNNDYSYYLSQDSSMTVSELAVAFSRATSIDKDVYSEVVGTDTYFWTLESVNTSFSGYVYFRRHWTVTEGGVPKDKVEYYPAPIQLIYNVSDASYFPAIHHVTAYVGDTQYDGAWIPGNLTFTVITDSMDPTEEQPGGRKPFDPQKEKLAYSVDNGQNFTPVLNSNIVRLNDILLVQSVIIFRLSNISLTNQVFYTYGTGEGEHLICIDPYEPTFIVRAEKRTEANEGEGGDESNEYKSNEWTSSAVTFTITNTSDCYKDNGAIKYEVSMNGGEYMVTNTVMTVDRTTQRIQFRATSKAGRTSMAISSFNVNIDPITPNVSIMATTTDPDKEKNDKDKARKTLSSEYVPASSTATGYYQFEFANGDIAIDVFNRSIGDVAMQNTSGVVFEYMEKNNGVYSGTWKTMVTSVESQDKTGRKDDGYRLEKSITTAIKLTGWCKFRIRSNAGLISQEVEVYYTVLKSAYSIGLGKIESEMNDLGWIADKAEVWISVPSDAVKDSYGSYNTQSSMPTLKYTFYYKASNSTDDKETSVVGTPVDKGFHEEKQNLVYWWYKFDLRASADSMFIIYVKNEAGKKSANTVTTDDKIKIDVLDPEYLLTAYIEPADANMPENARIYLDVDNPGWVNGQIHLQLSVKNSVSGIYVKELYYVVEDGEIVRNETTGEIVWQTKNQIMQGNPKTEGQDLWYDFPITINPSGNVKSYIGTIEYRYRIFTNSGRTKDVSFIANIDTSELIALKEIKFNSDGKRQTVNVENDLGRGYFDLDELEYSVCKNTTVSFASNLDKKNVEDHYQIRYKLFDGSGIGADRILAYASLLSNDFLTIDAGDNFTLPVPQDARGDYYVAVYIDSMARDYRGENISAGPYVFKLHYDTKNLNITYQIEAYDGVANVSEAVNRGDWVKGQLFVTIQIKKGDSAGDYELGKYLFYYIGLNSVNDTSYSESDWILVDDGNVSEDTTEYSYRFTLPFENASFKKYLGVSVCNAAGYRSTQQTVHTNEIKIDNTVPSVDEVIHFSDDAVGEVGIRGDETEKKPNASTTYTLFSYYSTADIILRNQGDTSRSSIKYYYQFLGQEEINASKLKQNLSSMKELKSTNEIKVFNDANISIGENMYQIAYYAIYAVNEVNTEAEGGTKKGDGSVEFTQIYRFIYDSSTLSGHFQNDSTIGSVDPQTMMFTYKWKDNICLSPVATGSAAPANESGYIMYQFSVDGGLYWYNYNYGGLEEWSASGEDVNLYFSPDLLRYYYNAKGVCEFTNGVCCTFSFRARNKAGATYVYDNIFIAMEDTEPQFTVKATVNGEEYDGGSNVITNDPSNWANSAIMLKVEVSTRPASGITYMYYLEYINGSSPETTKQKKFNGEDEFSTDTLDGFERNRDAVLHIIGTSNSSSDRKCEVVTRIAVDQVVPEFNLTGSAFNKGTQIATSVASGNWTNRNTVSISRAAVNTNVSQVEYKYCFIINETESEWSNWGEDMGSLETSESCTLKVIAQTQSKITYEKEFIVRIDTTPPIIQFDGGINVIENAEYYIDLRVRVLEANINICQYITIRDENKEGGFAFNPAGYILSTSSVDNSIRYDKNGEEYRGYVKIVAEDYAGNRVTKEFYILPFRLTVNNITLSDEDLAQVDDYEEHLNKARGYMESNRIAYFENLISRLRDRISTLETEIEAHRQYLEDLSRIDSYTLTDHYRTMYEFNETFHNYAVYNNAWIQTAITGDSTSKYYAYYQRFKTEFGKLQALMKQVETVEDHVRALPAINMVEAGDYEDILRVYNEYRNLTQDQREAFATNLKNKLDDMKEACEVLLLVDANMGVKINGDFAPGATIDVTQYNENTDTYTKAQKVLYEQVSAEQPRTIVSVYRIALDDEYAQTSASDITVTLPIAKDYQDYIYFSVYELSNDGSIKLVKDTEIQADGQTVEFKTSGLTTYVLCAKTELQKSDTSEGVYGSILGLELTAEMIKYLLYIGAALFGIVLLVVLITGIRHRRFLNSYNKAYRHSLYVRSVKGVPKGNKVK